jgi:hypothetical protein
MGRTPYQAPSSGLDKAKSRPEDPVPRDTQAERINEEPPSIDDPHEGERAQDQEEPSISETYHALDGALGDAPGGGPGNAGEDEWVPEAPSMLAIDQALDAVTPQGTAFEWECGQWAAGEQSDPPPTTQELDPAEEQEEVNHPAAPDADGW